MGVPCAWRRGAPFCLKGHPSWEYLQTFVRDFVAATNVDPGKLAARRRDLRQPDVGNQHALVEVDELQQRAPRRDLPKPDVCNLVAPRAAEHAVKRPPKTPPKNTNTTNNTKSQRQGEARSIEWVSARPTVFFCFFWSTASYQSVKNAEHGTVGKASHSLRRENTRCMCVCGGVDREKEKGGEREKEKGGGEIETIIGTMRCIDPTHTLPTPPTGLGDRWRLLPWGLGPRGNLPPGGVGCQGSGTPPSM